MTDLFPEPGNDWRRKFKRLLLDLDARIDSAVFQSGKWARELYERFTAIMDHCHVAGWRRWLIVEPLSEAATWAPARSCSCWRSPSPPSARLRTRTG